MQEFIGQAFGIAGLIVIVMSFQCKQNKNFFLMQGLGSLLFFVNYILIGAIAGALFNLTNLLRGFLFMKEGYGKIKATAISVLYAGCLAFSFTQPGMTMLVAIVSVILGFTLIAMTFFMMKGNSKHIRYFQVALMSPAWIVYNVINFTLGGILCESFNMVSSVVFLIRTRKDGAQKKAK